MAEYYALVEGGEEASAKAAAEVPGRYRLDVKPIVCRV